MEVKLDKKYPLDVSVEQAWAVLSDIRATAACMPGAQITEQLDDTHFKGTVKSKVGPAVMSFGGDIEVLQLDAGSRTLQQFGARLDAEHLYRTWQVVSLARLQSDGELEVRTKAGTALVFGANGDFFQQLAKLDYQWDAFANMPTPPAKIDLSLGREVSVAFRPAGLVTIGTAPAGPAKAAATAPAHPFFSHSQPKPKL